MKTHHNLYLLVSLLLLLLFAAGSFSLLSTEIFAYRRLNETIQSQEDVSLPLAYVLSLIHIFQGLNEFCQFHFLLQLSLGDNHNEYQRQEEYGCGYEFL